MTDSTNKTEPEANVQLSGDAARQAAIKRLQSTGLIKPEKKKKAY